MEKVDPTESDFSRSKTLGSWWFARHRSHIGSKKSHPMHQPGKIDKRSDLRFVFSFWLWPLLLGLWCISSRHLALDERNLWLHWSQHKVSGSSNTFKWKSSFCTNPSACTLDGNSQSTACRCPFFLLFVTTQQKYAEVCKMKQMDLPTKCLFAETEMRSSGGRGSVHLRNLLMGQYSGAFGPHGASMKELGNVGASRSQATTWQLPKSSLTIWCKIPRDPWIVNNIQLLVTTDHIILQILTAHRIVPQCFSLLRIRGRLQRHLVLPVGLVDRIEYPCLWWLVNGL